MKKKAFPLLIVLLIAPFFLWGILHILPTFDDWNTLSSPNFNTDYQQFFFRHGVVWRPLDALMGYIVAINYHLFPTLNHICIFIGHLGNTFLVYKLSEKLEFGNIPTLIATLFFYLSPAMLGTVLSVDSLNQTYSLFWGLMALWMYIHCKSFKKYFFWILFTWIAVLSKENGITWSIAIPVFAYIFHFTNKKELFKDICVGFGIAISYAAIRMAIPYYEIINNEYFTFSIQNKLMDLFTLIAFTWVPADYVSIIHEPNRNLFLASLTTVLSIPFLYLLFIYNRRIWLDKVFWGLVFCILIVQSPHILTVISIMHIYGSLAIAAIMVGYILHRIQQPKISIITFILFLTASIITDIHHLDKSIETSQNGKKMAIEAIQKTGKPVQKTFTINIDNEIRKYSSFCVNPIDAFADGQAVEYETGYQWPMEVSGTTITQHEVNHIDSIAQQAFRDGYECVWILHNESIDVMFPNK